MRILILSPIDPAAIEELQAEHDVILGFKADPAQLGDLIADRDVAVLRSGVDLNRELLARALNLRLVIRAGSGTDNIDLGYLAEHGIRLERVPEPGAWAVAELALGLMLTLARQIPVADRLLQEGHWAKYQLQGYLLTGKTLGIVGAGNIGSQVGRLGAAWDMRVLGCVEHPEHDAAERLAPLGIELASFDGVVAEADFLSIHVPLQPSTRNLIDAAVLARVKPGAFLTNLARGGVVDEQALFHALTSGGRLRGAALDVHAQEGEGRISPLAGLPNVILTPHIGASTVDTQRQIGQRVLACVAAMSAEAVTVT